MKLKQLVTVATIASLTLNSVSVAFASSSEGEEGSSETAASVTESDKTEENTENEVNKNSSDENAKSDWEASQEEKNQNNSEGEQTTDLDKNAVVHKDGIKNDSEGKSSSEEIADTHEISEADTEPVTSKQEANLLTTSVMALSLAGDETFEKDSVTYKVISSEDKTVQIGNGASAVEGLSGNVTIPSTVEYDGVTYTVSAIGDKAFLRNESITTLNLPSTIKSIGYMSFFGAGLTSITLPESIETLGTSCFSGSSLGSITLPNSVTEIPEQAFNLCEQLTTINLPSNLVTIGKEAFNSCAALTEITIPAKVTTIGEKAFWGGESLKKVTFEDNSELKSIGKLAFQFCEQLESVNLPASIETLEESAFQNCKVLKTTGLETLESNLKYIGKQTFAGTQIKNIIIPSTTATIELEAFRDCTKLKAISVSESNTNYSSDNGVLYDKGKTRLIVYPSSKLDEAYTTPSTLQTITDYAFSNSANLEEITITDGVTSVGAFVFVNSPSLKKVTFGKNVESIGRLSFQNCTKLKNVILPENLASVPEYLFYKCTGLIEITIPAKVTAIQGYILDGCENLESVTIQGMNVTMNTSAFKNVPNTTEYTVETDALKAILVNDLGISSSKITSKGNDPIPEIDNFTVGGIYYKVLTDPSEGENGTVQVGNGGYASFSVKSEMTIPEVVTESLTGQKYTVAAIGDYAFAADPEYGSSLKKITIPKTVISLGKNAFYECGSLNTVHFEEGSMLTSMNANCFDSCTSLQAISLPSGIKNIGEKAFWGCKYLNTCNFGNSLESIGASAFSGTKLKNIDLPATLKSIGTQAFYECVSLEAIHIASGNAAYSSVDGVLMDKSKTTLIQYPIAKAGSSYHVPDSIKTIKEYAFYKNNNIVTLEIGTGTNTIEANAMNSMASLQNVSMNDGVSAIGKMAFYKCKNLESVSLSKRVTTLADYLFYSCDALNEIEIPKGVISFGNNPFGNNLQNITIKSTFTTSNAIEFGSTFNSLTSAQYKVATETVKNKLIEKGIPEGKIEVVSSLLEDDIKESSFTKDGILYVVLTNPETGVNGTVQVGDGNALSSVSGNVVIPSVVMNNGYNYTVKTIAPSAFHATENMTSITLPNTIEKIGLNGISSNAKLTTVVFEEGSMLKELDNGAISDNMNLQELIIPASLETVHDYVFAWNYGLKKVTFEENSKLTQIGKGMFFRGRLLADLTIPDTITVIGEEAFYNCESLTGIKVKGQAGSDTTANLKNVHTIGASAFYGCADIENIILSDDLTELENGAFYGCTSLEEIALGKGLKTLGVTSSVDAEEDFKGVFEGCTSLEKITFPESVVFIGKNTLFGCNSLKKIIISSNESLKVGLNAFYGISSDAIFIVKKGAVKSTLVSSGKIDGSKIIAADELENLVGKAEKANVNKFTTDDFNILQEKLSNAKNILNDLDKVTAEVFNNSVKDLSSALSTEKKSKKKKSSDDNESSNAAAPSGAVKDTKSSAPKVETEEGGQSKVSDDGKSAAFVPEDGYMVKDVIVNGVSMGPLESIHNLKPTDKVVVVFDKAEEVVEKEGKDIPSPEAFHDIEKHWAHDAIVKAIEKGLIKGNTETEFSPDKSLTRQEAIGLLYVLFGDETSSVENTSIFQDVSDENEYKEAILWAYNNGIVSGTGDNSFSPEKDITREDMAALIYRCNSMKGYDTSARSDVNQFSDKDSISDYAYENISWAVSKGILQGKSENTLAPREHMTKAEAASIAERIENTK